MSDQNKEIEHLRTEIIEQKEKLESLIIRQEHRPFQIILNLFKFRKTDKSDPKRSASFKAFIWWLVSPAGVTSISFPFIAIFGIYIGYQANTLLETQNEKITQQTYLLESQRRSALVFELSNIFDKIDNEITKWEQEKNATTETEVKLSPILQNRIIAVSNSLKPYFYLDNEGKLTKATLSPERGQLLLSLFDLNIRYFLHKCDFSSADLSDAIMIGAMLNRITLFNANLSGANLTLTKLRNADLRGANLSGANLKGTDLSGADLRGADLSNVDLRNAILKGTKLRNAKLDNAKMCKADKSVLPKPGASFNPTIIWFDCDTNN